MKKIFALLALVLGVVSCQTEPEGLDVNVGGEQEVMLTVSLPETTRANSANGFNLSTLADTDYSLRYILEVYLGENCQRHVLVSDNTTVAFPVRLAPDRNYQLVVWADIVVGESKADRYYNTDPENGGLKAVSIVDSTWNAMDETRDAFTSTKAVSAQDIASGAITMTLKRPFAKLRVVATDYKDVVELGLKPATATVVYSQGMPRTYNALNATPVFTSASSKSHTITYPADTADAVYSYENGEYTLFADYFFVPEFGTAKFQFNVYADANQTNLIKATNFNTDIHVAANKLTTIKGDVLTTGANINIDIEGGMDAPSYEYNAIGNATAFYEALNNGGEYIVTSDLVIDQAYVPSAQRTATRTTGATAEGKVTTINLNGKTITVTNKTTAPFATVADGNILLLEGGNIVLTEDSTASFIKNDGNVVLTSGEIKSNSSSVAVINGDIVVDGGEVIDLNATTVTSKQWLEDVLTNGGTYVFTDDMTASENIEVTATVPVVLDGNGKTITFTDNANRGFRITKANTVTFKDVAVINNVAEGRCVDTRTGNINLTLENVTLTATNGYYSQPFTVGGSGKNINVNINNSTIDAGNNGYGITTFNPVALNINASTITGYAALNIKLASNSEGSAGSVINVVNSTLNGVNNVTANESNSFSTIMIEDNNIKINVDSTSIVKATTSNGNGQCIVGFGNELVTSKISGCELTFAGEIVLEGEQTSYVGYSTNQGSLGNNTVKFAVDYKDALEAEGWIVGEPTDGLVTVYSAIAQVGDNVYKTLAEAVAAAEDGNTITLVADEKFTERNRTHNSGSWYDGLYYIGDKSFTIDLGGYTISQDGAVNDYLLNFKNVGSKANTITIKNGTIDAGTTAFCALCTASSHDNQLTINLEDVTIFNKNSNGSTAKIRGRAILNVKDGAEIIGKDSYLGIECVASTVNIYDGAEIYMNGTTSYNGCLAGACGGGTINVYGGYGKGVKGGFIAMTSGGTINVSGGEWIANNDGSIGDNSNVYVLTAQSNKNESGFVGGAYINVTGGTFRGGMDAWVLNNVEGEEAKLSISGGNFNANPSSYLAEGYVVDEKDGIYSVVKDEKVAKVGTTEYRNIDEAIANWTNNSTLTLLSDVTLTDVITLKSTEHHILDLGTYTMTAASGKNAFVIKATGWAEGDRSEHSAFTINADANNPGGINAGNKSIVYYKYTDGGITSKDRPIIKINGGIFYGGTSSFGTSVGIYYDGDDEDADKAATLNITGGTFNCSIVGAKKSKLLISGGLFHYSVGSQGDSTALRLISGGTFKSFGFMTADSKNTKFWIGTSMKNSDVGLYINDDNYLVVGGPVIKEFGDKFTAKATNPTKWNSLLQYSSAAANGLYYTNADMAIQKHGADNVELK